MLGTYVWNENDFCEGSKRMSKIKRSTHSIPSGSDSAKVETFLKWLAVISTVGLFIVNLVGFLDTQTNSAMGCGPDWPLCNGAVIPSLSNTHVIIEFAHRMIVATFATIAGVFSIWAIIRYRHWREAKIFGGISIAFMIIQSFLGAAAVIWVNPPAVLALHLGFGIMGMIGVLLLAVFIFQHDRERRGLPNGLSARKDHILPRPISRRIWIVWIYTYGAMYFGSYVAFRHAGPSCQGWPLCNGSFFPGFQGLVGLDYTHRLIAVGLAILVGDLWLALRRHSKNRNDVRQGTVWLGVFTATQIATGAELILHHIGTGYYLLHVSNLMILFSILSYLAMQTLPSRNRDTSPTKKGSAPIPR